MRCLLSIALIFFFSVSIATAGADETATSLIANGRVDEAIANLHGQISASPNDAQAHNFLCRAYFSLGDWDHGISDCEKAVALAPNNSQFHLWLGRIYGEKADGSSLLAAAGLARRVRNEFEIAVRLNPGNVDARSDLAEFYLEAPGVIGGGRDKAEAQASSLATIDPVIAHGVRARIAEKRKDYSAAEWELRAAINASGGSASAWLNLGLFYKHRQQLDQMQNALQHVRSAPLDRPEALVDAAEMLIHTQRNLPEATQLLRAYLSSNAKVEQAPAFKAHFLLGAANEQLGRKKDAAAEYKTALSMAKEFRPAQQGLQRVSQ